MGLIISLLLVIHVLVCLLLVLIVMMQRPRQEGLGAAFGGGMTDQMFGAQTTNVLQKGTVWLATIFFINTLVMAILIGIKNKRQAEIDRQIIEGPNKERVLPPAEQRPAEDRDSPKEEKTAQEETQADPLLEENGGENAPEAPLPQTPSPEKELPEETPMHSEENSAAAAEEKKSP